MDLVLRSKIIVGTMRMTGWGANMTVDQAEAFIKKSLALGLNVIDTADIYGYYSVETLLGQVFARNPGLREKFKIITKCGICLPCPSRPHYKLKCYDSSSTHILSSVDMSLRELQTNHIDMLLIHRPDPLTRASEIAKTFYQLRDSGKVKCFGVSNYSIEQLETLQNELNKISSHNKIIIETNQVQFSPFHLTPLFDGTFAGMERIGIIPQIWSPFDGGKLFLNSAEPVQDPQVLRILFALSPIATKYDVPIDAIVLSWIFGISNCPDIVIGTTKELNLETAVKSLKITLTRDEWYTILEAARGHEIA